MLTEQILAVGSIRVAFIATQSLYAKALCYIIAQQPDFESVSDICRFDEAELRALAPNLVLIDLDDLELDFADLMSRLSGALPDIRVCVISGRHHVKTIQRCMDGGADGFVVKDIAPAALVEALRIVASGMPYVDARVGGTILRDRMNQRTQRTRTDELSPREAEIIRLIAQGLPNKHISAKLQLSDKTVKNHISRIFVKLNITARTQAAVYAIRAGII